MNACHQRDSKGRQAGNEAFREGRFAQAVELYTRAITDFPTDHRLFTNRSTALIKLKNFQQAVLDGQRAVQLCPSWAKGYLRIAQALQGAGKLKAAREALAEGLRRCPEQRGALEEGLRALQAAQEAREHQLIPPSAFAHMSHGEKMLKLGATYELYPPPPPSTLQITRKFFPSYHYPHPEDDDGPEDGEGSGYVVPVALPGCMEASSAEEEAAAAGVQAARDRGGKFVLVVPLEGLCNRLRALASALLLAEDMGRAVLVCWRRSPECAAAWEDLFRPHPLIRLVPDAALPAEAATWTEPVQGPEARHQWLQAVAHGRYDPDRPGPYRAYDAFDCLVFATCEEFYPGHTAAAGPPPAGDAAPAPLPDPAQFLRSWRGVLGDPAHPHRDDGSRALNTLRPRARICRHVARLPPFSCGVHVRCTDHFNQWHSPLEMYFRAMEDRIDRQPRTKFFLSTDDPQVESMMLDRYGTAVVHIYPKRSRDRRSQVAIEDALIDLMHLAQTEELIGSYWSSFTEVAASYRMQPLHIIYRPLDMTDDDMVAEAMDTRVNATAQYPY